MTAINAIVQPSAVHMLTDTAVFDMDGRILRFRDKMAEFPDMRLAVAWTGYGSMSRASSRHKGAEKAIRELAGGDQQKALAVIPALLRTMHQQNIAEIPTSDPAYASIACVVAMWCMKSNEGQVYMADSEPGALHPEYQPYTLQRLRRFVNVGSKGAAAPEFDYEDDTRFRPEIEGLQLLEIQRGFTQNMAGNADRGVGGQARWTKIDANGIRTKTLKRWPDKVGQLIQL